MRHLESLAMIALQQNPKTRFFATKSNKPIGNATIEEVNAVQEVIKMENLQIRRSSNDPFLVPTINTKRNTDRYLLASKVLQSYFKNFILPHTSHELQLIISELFSSLDNYYQRSPALFCEYVASHGNWIKRYFLTGSRDRAGITDLHWAPLSDCPTDFAPLIAWMRRNSLKFPHVTLYRFILTMFSLHKVITVPKAPSLESITKSFTGKDESGSFMKFDELINKLGVDHNMVKNEFTRLCASNTFKENLAAGPNGSALWSAHLDAYILYDDPTLYKIIRDFAKETNMTWVSKMISNIHSHFGMMDYGMREYTNTVHSRLHCLFEKATKSRIIAIGDYFSQTLLSPVHDILTYVLKDLPMDSTFDQEGGFRRILELSKGKSEVFSLDLSKATDRIPVKALVRMISILVGSDQIGNLWGQLLTNRTFWTQLGHGVNYKVGQPMGFKSSFPAMALFHHFVVQCAHKGEGMFTDYQILGDDIVIIGRTVADEYKRLMADLGLEISETKSLEPVKDSIAPCGFEFCSRFGRDGVEYTPLPLTAILKTIDNPDTIVSLWGLLIQRGIFKDEAIWQFLAIFVPVKTLNFLLILNLLPSYCTGIAHPIPLRLSGQALEKARNRGFTDDDVANMYMYNVITETLIKLEGVTKQIVNWTGIINGELNTRPDDLTISPFGTNRSLAAIVADHIKVKKYDDAIHPIQSVVASTAEKIVRVLNIFKGTSINPKLLADGELLSSLTVDFGTKAKYIQSSRNDAFGSRKTLSKTIRQLNKLAKSPDSKSISFTARVEGAAHLWVVKVGIGVPLTITPHVAKLANINEDRVANVISEVIQSFDINDEI